MISPSPPSPVMTSTIVSPPTPAPSPRPDLKSDIHPYSRPTTIFDDELDFARDVRSAFDRLDPPARKRFLAELIQACDIDQLVFISNAIAPRLKRDFLRELPTEISLHVLSFIDDPKTLVRASGVSRFWRNLLSDEYTWKMMCMKHNFIGGAAREAFRHLHHHRGGLGTAVGMTEPGSSSPIWELASSSSTHPPEHPNSSRMSVDGDSDAETSNPATSTTATDEESRPFQRFNNPTPPTSSTNNITRSARTNRPIIESKRALASKQKKLKLPTKVDEMFSYQRHFRIAYLTEANWRRGGRVLKSHTSADDGVVTSVAMNDEWIVAGLVNHRIHVFAADTGLHVRTLVGHTQGVWCLNLVSRGGSPAAATRTPNSSKTPRTSFGGGDSSCSEGGGLSPGIMSKWDSFTMDEGSAPGPSTSKPRPMFGSHLTPSDICNASVGWGQNMSLVVSGGCDRDLRVWDTSTGVCLQSLKGHTSTIRCLKVLDGRPIAVTGSRDATLRVWDIQRGRCLHLLSGHTSSVRCLDVAGNIAVSGSYDCTARLWNVDTGECLRVFEGHYHQIYAVAFDGIRVATGSLDSTVRVWSPETGECSVVLQGHTSLVGQLQLNGDTLVSGGSDGRVIIFSLTTFETLNRLCAHDNSVTCLQFDDRFLITGGNDGHVKLFEMGSGIPIRELTEPCEAVWRVNFKHDKCVIMCKRGGKTVMEILSFRPPEDQA